MSSTFSAELAPLASVSSEPECEPSLSVKSSRGAAACLPNDGQMSLATMISERSTLPVSPQMELLPMSSAAGSHAKTSAWQAKALDLLGSGAASGPNTQDWFASCDLDTYSLRTSQRCFLEDWTVFSATLPPRGMMRSGKLFQLPTSEPFIEGKGSGFRLIPTPTACDHKGSGRLRLERGPNNNLRDWFKINFGFLYPPVRAVEWLMGFPIEHTALRLSETPSSRRSRKSSAEQS
jgi:hypothetical protein